MVGACRCPLLAEALEPLSLAKEGEQVARIELQHLAQRFVFRAWLVERSQRGCEIQPQRGILRVDAEGEVEQLARTCRITALQLIDGERIEHQRVVRRGRLGAREEALRLLAL